jgi:hypothetical protein
MGDHDVRVMERALRAAPDDVGLLIRYVAALDAGKLEPPADLLDAVRRARACVARAPEHTGIEEGDEVWVEELDTPWIHGRWRGWVTRVWIWKDELRGHERLAYRVRPDFGDDDGSELPWRIRPDSSQRVRGLELGSEVKLELIAKQTDPFPRVFG